MTLRNKIMEQLRGSKQDRCPRSFMYETDMQKLDLIKLIKRVASEYAIRVKFVEDPNEQKVFFGEREVMQDYLRQIREQALDAG